MWIKKNISNCYKNIMSVVARGYFLWHGVSVGTDLHMYSLPICRRYPSAKIQIGDHVKIYNKSRENLSGVIRRCVIAATADQAQLIIGNHVGMSGVVLYAKASIVIGNYCLLGSNCQIFDTDFHSLNYLDRRASRSESVQSKPVLIGDDVWIGANALVLKGVRIGSRSVIAANSVVTHDIPEDVIAGGVPARVIGPALGVEALLGKV